MGWVMRTDFPYDLYLRPVAVQVAAKLTACPPAIGENVYIYFEHGSMEYWVMYATDELIAAIQVNLSLPYWNAMRETNFWFNQLSYAQAYSTGLDYKMCRSWYPEGTELTNDVLHSEYS